MFPFGLPKKVVVDASRLDGSEDPNGIVGDPHTRFSASG
jgi:hypothetical protein